MMTSVKKRQSEAIQRFQLVLHQDAKDELAIDGLNVLGIRQMAKAKAFNTQRDN